MGLQLADVPTCELIMELEKRDGVQTMRVEPHEPYAVSRRNEGINEIGPAMVLIIID